MQSTIVKNELVVGTFVALAVILTLVYFGKKTRERGLLDIHRLSFSVPHGSGLESGSPVLMKGIQVGEIDDVELTDDHKVLVTCSITPRFAKHISSDAKAAVVEPPILGTTKVELQPGVSDTAAEDEQMLESFTKADLFERVERIEARINGVIAKVDSLVDTASTTVSSISKITKSIEESRGLVGRLINDPNLADDAEALLGDLRQITKDIREGKGVLGMTVNDGEFAGDVKAIVHDARVIADDIEQGKGSLGRLYKDSTLVEETEGMITDARGSLAKLNELNDEARASMQKVQELLDNTNEAVSKIDGLVGSAGDVTGELTKSLKKINEGEGTIAALLNDDALYKETKSLLKELRESVEDLREQAPINSFIGVVFSAF